MVIKRFETVSNTWMTYLIDHNHEPTFCGFVSDNVDEMIQDISEMDDHYFLCSIDEDKLTGILLVERYQENSRWIAETWGPFGNDFKSRQMLVCYLYERESSEIHFFGTNLTQYFAKLSRKNRSLKTTGHRRLIADVTRLSQLATGDTCHVEMQTYQLSHDAVLTDTVKSGCLKLFNANFPGGSAAFDTILADYDQSTMICCFSNQQIVGFNLYARDGEDLFLNYIIVDDHYRHQGIARSLVKTMCLQNLDQKKVHLNWPLRKQAAGDFYTGLHFKVERTLESVSVQAKIND